MRSTMLLITLASLSLAAACHSAPKPEPPAPQPSEAELARQQQVQDSLAAVARATADSVERAKQLALAAETARADSVERQRLAAAQSASLREELGVMVHFDAAQSQLLPDGVAALDRKVAILKANPAVRLQITGACDDRGTTQYNMALGTRRAAAVKVYLVDQGIDVARLDDESLGEGAPIAAGNDETAWAQNRRAQFLIVSDDGLLAMR